VRFFASLRAASANLVLVNMATAGMDGGEVIRVLRAAPETTDLLIVAVSAGEPYRPEDAVRGLRAGADEYMAAPVDCELLVERVSALLRRAPGTPPPSPVLKLGPLLVLPGERTCRLKGKTLSLTRLEFEVLLLFLRQANRVLTRRLLMDAVWKGDAQATTRTVDKHVQTLRRKLGPVGTRIETLVRVGYVLRV
jgi:DNA-binding response OmpR family regulator